MKYRKLPIVIDAIQWDGSLEGAELIARTFDGVQVHAEANGPRPPRLAIPTLEGVMTASAGDYIIKGVQGEVYPCKPDIFEASYECAS